jgi:hypothetical protein
MAKYIVQHRRGTTAQWMSHDTLIPFEGEIVIEIDEENFLHKLKIGDGIHAYSELAYLAVGDEVVTQVLAKAQPRVVTITLDVDKWSEIVCKTDESLCYYGQTVTIDDVTAHSRLDLQPDANMLAEFQTLDLVFVTENKGGGITVYSVGDMPLKSYTMQATIVETNLKVESEAIVGIPIGSPTTKSDWAQTDETKSDYIKNKPTILTEEEIIDLINKWGNPSEATQLPSDWAQTDETQVDYIRNKPQLGALAEKDVVSESELSDDIKTALNKANTALQSYEETDPTVPDWAKAETKPTYTANEVSAVSYEPQTLTPEQQAQARSNIGAGANAFSGSYNDLIDKPAIPNALSDLTEDETHRTVTDAEKESWSKKSAFSGSYNDLTDKPTIPSALSDLSDDTTHRTVTDDEKNAWNAKSAFSGSYNDLTDKPSIPSTDGLASITYVDTKVGDKVDKVEGMGLSTNDFTTAEKNKLGQLVVGAEANVQSDWNQSDDKSDDYIKNKPTIPTALSALTDDAMHRTVTDTEKEAWNKKVDAVNGKGLSTNDFTTSEKQSLTNLSSVLTPYGNYVTTKASNSVGCVRNILVGIDEPSVEIGVDGDIYIQYSE